MEGKINKYHKCPSHSQITETQVLSFTNSTADVCVCAHVPAMRSEASSVTRDPLRPRPTHLQVPVFLGLTCVISSVPLDSRITLQRENRLSTPSRPPSNKRHFAYHLYMKAEHLNNGSHRNALISFRLHLQIILSSSCGLPEAPQDNTKKLQKIRAILTSPCLDLACNFTLSCCDSVKPIHMLLQRVGVREY